MGDRYIIRWNWSHPDSRIGCCPTENVSSLPINKHLLKAVREISSSIGSGCPGLNQLAHSKPLAIHAVLSNRALDFCLVIVDEHIFCLSLVMKEGACNPNLCCQPSYAHERACFRISHTKDRRGKRWNWAPVTSLKHLTNYLEDYPFSRCSHYKNQ
jgi:hypothetical protein